MSPLSERRLTEHPYRGMYLFTRMSAVASAVNSAAETACFFCAPAETIGEKDACYGRDAPLFLRLLT